MTSSIRNVQVFAGTVQAASPQFQGMKAPATLTLIDRETEYECRFLFFAPEPVSLTVRAPRTAASVITGIADDPRGWKVSFDAKLYSDRVSGSYKQPHDWGTFDLVLV